MMESSFVILGARGVGGSGPGIGWRYVLARSR